MKTGHSHGSQRARGAYRKRQVAFPPRFNNFKPSGIPRSQLDQVVISLDEYEALRLADYLGQDHLQSADQMKISRPTFSRLIEKARTKVAQALVNGLELVIEGGNIDFSLGRHRCRNCGEEQTHALDTSIIDCPECGSADMEDLSAKFITPAHSSNRGNQI